MMQPIVWTIGGSDPSGGAGIQADLHTLQQLGVHGASVITAITAQNARHITDIHYVLPEQIATQLATLQSEMPANVIKIGMLGHAATIACLRHFLQNYAGFVALDPVLVATSGRALFTADIENYIQQLTSLFPRVDLLTPNVQEAEILTGMHIQHYQDIKKAANALLALGVKNVLIKGGHFANDHFSQDYWTNDVESCWLANFRYPPKNYRGTGCVFASATAASLALGYGLKDALVIAKMYINQGIRLAQAISEDTTLLTHVGWPEDEIDLPYVSDQPLRQLSPSFPHCGTIALGLYPIVDSSEWLKTLLPTGVEIIQLRIKDKRGRVLENEIQQSINLANQYGAQLFINDYWELAIRYGAYGVHLGQDDLKTADIKKIYQAGLRLGISTHCYYEVAQAHRYRPSYLACGPIFATMSKIMAFSPQGITHLKRWQRTLKNYPVVAIGGINSSNISDVLATNVSGIAMISAITQAQDPIQATQTLLEQVKKYHRLFYSC